MVREWSSSCNGGDGGGVTLQTAVGARPTSGGSRFSTIQKAVRSPSGALHSAYGAIRSFYGAIRIPSRASSNCLIVGSGPGALNCQGFGGCL